MSDKTILLVEDEPPMTIVLQDSLRRDGLEVLTAKNGIEGLSIAKEKHPTLILLDILMPKMDGMTMLTELRKDAWGKTANVMVLTNFSDNEKQKAAADLGVIDFLLKADLTLVQIVDIVKKKLATL